VFRLRYLPGATASVYKPQQGQHKWDMFMWSWYLQNLVCENKKGTKPCTEFMWLRIRLNNGIYEHGDVPTTRNFSLTEEVTGIWRWYVNISKCLFCLKTFPFLTTRKQLWPVNFWWRICIKVQNVDFRNYYGAHLHNFRHTDTRTWRSIHFIVWATNDH